MTTVDTRLFDVAHVPTALLADQFGGVPPFSVLNAREGWWQDRKRLWIDVGIKSEEGRSASFFTHIDGDDPFTQKLRDQSNGQSIFDPVLTELMYRWYCPPGGIILDPFAGGSVRGIVAAWLGYRYTGIDLSEKQIEANRAQWDAIAGTAPPGTHPPRWIAGNSADVLPALVGIGADYVFSCPPYYDREVYSDGPTDLSTMTWADFVTGYSTIIRHAIRALRPNRHATFVVSEIRSKTGTGLFRGLVPTTIDAFEMAGADYYTEIILINSIGTLALRAAAQMRASRKIGRTHQNVLGFIKGDPKAAAVACGPLEFDGLPDTTEAP